MSGKSIIIIGAGIAGLATGCYGQMNGYETQIFELHTLPGGLCTAWKRKGYIFDGCIHWLVGSRPDSPMHQLWEELGAAQDRPIVNHEFYFQAEGMGKTLTFYNDIDQLETHLKSLSPIDGDLIDKFCKGARHMTRLDMPLDSSNGLLAGIKAGIRMLPALFAMRRWGNVPMPEFARGFQDPLLQTAFLGQYEGMEQIPAIIPMMTLAWMHKEDAGYPIGGSLALAQDIERRYREMGGVVHYKSRVEKILVENHRAVGVRLTDGSEHRADDIISAADGHSTIFNMLDGNYVDDTIRGYYERWPIFPPIIQVSLGINRDLSGMPHMLMEMLDTPVTVAGEVRHHIGLRHFCYDPTMAPEGKSVVTAMFPSNHAHWKKLAAERAAYEAEKQNTADIAIAALERRYPGIAGDVEVVDVATPLTTERFTGNWQGSMEGWLVTPQNINMIAGKGMRKTLPGLEHFYMAGQWVEPGGGIPTAAMSGRKLIQTLCKRDGHTFEATRAS